MAKRSAWLWIEELLERGDPAFVDELRKVEDAEQLARFAFRWYQDRRPASRRFLLEYLRRPLNAFHHEPLVKRLFKQAEKAGDDEAMAHFLVLFDRSVRRKKRKRLRLVYRQVSSEAQAAALMQQFSAEGAESVNQWGQRGRFTVTASWPEERIYVPPGTTLPRGGPTGYRNPRTGERIGAPQSMQSLPEPLRKKLEACRLFSVHTRNYLRRRSWRYFRRLGKQQPERYLPAVLTALMLYEDPDVATGLALLDNWGLIHILFHHSPALWARPHGWTLAPEHEIAELKPAPIFPELWTKSPGVFFQLLRSARCRPVRQWTLHYLRADPKLLAEAPLDELLALLNHEDAEVAALAAQGLRAHPRLGTVSIETWLGLLHAAQPAALDTLCELVAAQVRPERLTLGQIISVACSRPVPIARLGLAWLKTWTAWTPGDYRLLWRLLDAPADPVRLELVRWARGVLKGAPEFQPTWVLEFLDSPFADVRAEGWAWLLEDTRARDDVEIWQRLLESPYDDVRLKIVEYLERRFAGVTPALGDGAKLDPEHLRLLWATVLLNIQRGSRSKPLVVQQVVRRLSRRLEEAPLLLPLLRVALRSVRGPEWRAGLAGIVQLVERAPDLKPMVESNFPELRIA